MPKISNTLPIAMDLTLAELNPNHKYRLVLIGCGSAHWLAELGIVRADESVYLMPLINRPCNITTMNSRGTQTLNALPKAGVHVSFHDSGAINLVLGRQRLQLRPRVDARPPIGRMFTIVVNSTASLAPVATAQINNSSARRRVVPLMAHWPGDVNCITVFRSTTEPGWKAPLLAELSQVNIHLPVRNKSVQYHVVAWQHRQLKAPRGEVAILMPDSP